MPPAFAPPGWQPAAPDLSGEPGPAQPVIVDPGVKDKYGGIEESFVFKAHILVNRQDGYIAVPLWLNTGMEDMPDFAVVESATIEWGPSIQAKISVSMKMDYQMGRWFLDSELSRFRNGLVVQAGYPKSDVWTPTFYGYLDPPQVTHDPTGYSITLSATVLSARLRRLAFDVGKWIKGSKTRRDVIKGVFSAVKIDLLFHLDPSTGRDEDNEWLDTEVETGPDGAGRFWPEDNTLEGIVNWVCMEAGMRAIMWPHPSTGEIYAITMVNRSTIASQDVRRELVLFAGVDPSRGVYPLTNFSSEDPAVYMDNLVGGAVASDIEPETKKKSSFATKEWEIVAPALGEESEGVRYGGDVVDPLSTIKTEEEIAADAAREFVDEVGPGMVAGLWHGLVGTSNGPGKDSLMALAEETLVPDSAASPIVKPSGAPMQYDVGVEDAPAGAILACPVGRDSDEKGKMQSVYEESLMQNGGIKANLETVGMPDATPEMKVAVRRVGARFDGIYNVRKITHTISTIWNTTFEAVKAEFGPGSGLLKTNRPLLAKETVEGAFPAWPVPEPAEPADAGGEEGLGG